MKKRLLQKIVMCLFSAGLLATVGYHMLFGEPDGVAAVLPVRLSGQKLIIDAGHGGEDGGAISSSGAVESSINLAVALRLDAILGLYGSDTMMLRTQDVSLHDADANTLREKKSSDLHNRVAAIEAVENATLISIHQNSFGDRKYRGAQVFYANNEQSAVFARHTQEMLRVGLDPNNTRQAAKIPTSVYLMNHVTCRAILVECGFLSNPAEDALLQTKRYQTKIAASLAGAYLGYYHSTPPEGDLFDED